jgi:hypothetical protein
MDYTTTEKWSSLEEIAEHLGVSKDTKYENPVIFEVYD